MSQYIQKSKLPSVEIPDISFPDFVWSHTEKWGDKIALECSTTGRSYSFTSARKMSRLYANYFYNCGLRQGQNIGVLLPNCPEFPLVVLGAQEAGLAVVTFCWFHTKEEIRKIIESLECPVLVTLMLRTAELESVCSENNVQIIELDKLLLCPSFSTTEGNLPTINIPPESRAFVAYSSGTTGIMKLIFLTHKIIMAHLMILLQLPPLHEAIEREIAGVSMLLAYQYGFVNCLIAPMLRGAKVVVLSEFKKPSMVKVKEDLKVSIWFVVPSFITILLSDEVSSFQLRHTKYIVTTGSHLSESRVNQFKQKFKNVKLILTYGATEVGTVLSSNVCENPGTTGYLVSNAKAKIIDPKTGKVLGPGEDGKLCVITSYSEVRQLDAQDSEGWICTGDIGNYDKNGLFTISGREKHVIKVDSLQVSAEEVEAVLEQHPDVLEAAVMGVPHPVTDESPVAIVVARDPGNPPTLEDLKKHLSQFLAPYKVVTELSYLPLLPRYVTGKIDRDQLKSLINR